MLKSMSRIALLPVVVALIVMAGCSSGGGVVVPGPDPNTGSVQGRVVQGLTNPIGFAGITVWIGTAATPQMWSADSAGNGDFTVTGITPRTVPPAYQVSVEINPATNLVPPPPDHHEIAPNLYRISSINPYVAAGGTTPVGTITLIDRSELPPDPV